MKYAELILVRLPRAVAAVLLLCMVIVNFANVVGRKIFSQAIFWSEEVMLFMLIWAVFLAGIAITYQGRHLRMDLFSAQLRPPWSYALNAFTAALFVAAAAFMVIQSRKVVMLMASTGQTSNAANIPMVILHLSVLVGFSAMALAVILQLRSYVTDRHSFLREPARRGPSDKTLETGTR